MTGSVFLEARRATALVERRRLIQRLRGLVANDAQRLANVLSHCSPRRPCRSAACPVCGIDFQLAAVALQEQVIGIPAKAVRHRKHALTIVPSLGCVPPDGLTSDLYLGVRDAIAAALIACDLPPNLFALDVSFNEDLTGRLPPHWCVHGDGIGLDWVSLPKIKALQKLFPKSDFVSKPVLAQRLDIQDEALLYAYKPERVRRVSFLTKDGLGGRSPHRAAKRYELRASQSTTLALIEHATGYRGRLITHKIGETALDELLVAFEWARDGP